MEELDKSKILDSISKVVMPKEPKSKKRVRINKLKFWCVGCTAKYEVNKKGPDGNILLPQQVCPHVTLTDIEMIRI